MKVMITGAAGFIGGFLARHAMEAGCSVLGFDIADVGASWCGADFEKCDVRDGARLAGLIATFRPERIFHLAAQSYPTVSHTKPLETMDINGGGTVNLFEGVRAAGISPVVVVACSSAEYGLVEAQDLPVKETHALNPLHPYGVSKVAQDLLAAQYFANYRIPSVRIRIFNTTGPGKIGDVCSDLARRAAEIELGLTGPALRVGNLAKRRAIADVRDLVHGLWVSAEACSHGDVYNLGGDQIYSVDEIIEAIRSQMKVPFTIAQDPVLMRACDEPVIAGDTSKFRACSGWRPRMQLAVTLRDMLNWWRAQLVPARIGQAAASGIESEKLHA